MSRLFLGPLLQRTILIGFAGVMLSTLAIGQELQPIIVTGVDLYRNPYSYRNKTLWLNPIPVPFVYNGRVMQYSQPSPDALPNVLALGYTGLSFERALDSNRLIFDLRQENYATSSSDLQTYGQLVIVARAQQQMPLRLDRIWVLRGLGSLEGTNGFGAPLTVPLVEFICYRGDESSVEHAAPTNRAGSRHREQSPSSLAADAPEKASYSTTTVTGSLIYMPTAGQAFLLRKGNLVLAFMDHGTWDKLKNKISDNVCVTLTGVFDRETQTSVVKQLRASGEKRDVLAIRNAQFVHWAKCQGDELGVEVPPREPKIVSTSPPHPECKAYAPAVVALKGHLISHTFAGPPNYSDVSKGDRPEVEWILNVTKPVCTNGSAVSQEYWQPAEQIWKTVVDKHPAVDGISQLQLVITEQKVSDRYKALLNRDVTVRGSLFNAETGHHHTPLLLMVSDIQLPADEQ